MKNSADLNIFRFMRTDKGLFGLGNLFKHGLMAENLKGTSAFRVLGTFSLGSESFSLQQASEAWFSPPLQDGALVSY